ncbi:oligopeptide transport system ATP-binding protein [Spiroplasma chinense]|uniref:Oligopeptide transport system ATP-binding protein n=1 Tax=Spiroplasma chinense TaxID=216932 RepID=A0A5B9Y5G9_9MOLU|nr:oligopeptide transport system ATP-binding protein [Spiroplasma chinense]
MNERKILIVDDVEVKFRVRNKVLKAIRGVSFDLYDQEILAIVGESGSGKSVITKTFTGMLESNGWISSGSITYFPSDDEGNIKPTDLVNTQRQITEPQTKKFILKNCKKIIKQLEKRKKLILETSVEKRKELTEKYNLKADEIALKKMKNENAFKESWFSRFTINKLEKRITQNKFILDLGDEDFKKTELNKIEYELTEVLKDYTQFTSISFIKKFSIGKAIKIMGNRFSQQTSLTEKEIKFINKKFKLKKYNSKLIMDLNELYKELLENNFEQYESFKSVEDDWKKIKNLNFINRKRANKEITKIRGKTIATIFQDPMTSLNPLLSVGFQICEVLKKHRNLSKNAAKKEAINLLEKVGIPNPEKRFKDIPSMYSGGMRQRVVIAIALACRPKILICDEPTTALDVTIQAQILELIRNLQKEYNFAIVFITHDLGVVASIATRIMVMYSGQVVEKGTVDEIFYNSMHPYTWALLLSLPQLGTKGEELYSIEGTPPSLFSKILGDSFAPRNKLALKIDYIHEPPLFKISETHFVKSWLLDKRAPKIEKPKELVNLHNFIKKQEGIKLNNEQ